MKQVAAAKIRRAEAARKHARPYADALAADAAAILIGAVHSVDHPFMKPGKSGAPAGIVLISADKGLAGAFNSNVIRAAEQLRARSAATRATTRRPEGAQRGAALGDARSSDVAARRRRRRSTRRARSRAARPTISGTATISEIVLVSQQLVTMMSQRPQTRKLVPLIEIPCCNRAQRAQSERGERRSAHGSHRVRAVARVRAVDACLPKYLEFTIYSAMLETDAAFFAAQLVAMTNATDNASKLIDELTIAMNNARQAAITKELLEIVGGAEALGVE